MVSNAPLDVLNHFNFALLGGDGFEVCAVESVWVAKVPIGGLGCVVDGGR